MRRARLVVPALLFLAVVTTACGDAERVGANSRVSAANGASDEAEPAPQRSLLGPGLIQNSPAPELEGIAGWINSDPLTLEGLRAENRVVLLDFWTYTCINCIRTLPFLRDWDEKYSDRGLTIIGVHAPEFDFEEDRENVQAAVARYDLDYPVAQDNDMETWQAFNNAFWPAKYLIGVDGAVRYQHFGEGSYQETERQIRSALVDAGYEVGDIPIGGLDAQRLDPHATAITRELYGGYERNFDTGGVYAAQDEYYEAPDRTFEYQDIAPGEQRNHNQWYLQGEWRNEREAIVHARETEQPEDYIAFRFVARSVNVVLEADDPYVMVVEIDGRPLTVDEAGADIVFDERGRSVVAVDEPRMYGLVQLPALGDRELRLSSTSDDFSLFAVTFGAYTTGA